MIAGTYPGPLAPVPAQAGLTTPMPVDAECPASARVLRRAHQTSMAHAGTVARGRPPSPYIGAGTIVAMQWVVFGACLLQWALA